MPKRSQTQTERDFEGMIAKARREGAVGLDLTPFHEGEITKTHSGEELDRARAEQRTDDERIAHLEKKNDALVAVVVKMAGDQGVLLRRIVIAIITVVGSYLAGKHL